MHQDIHVLIRLLHLRHQQAKPFVTDQPVQAEAMLYTSSSWQNSTPNLAEVKEGIRHCAI